MGKRVKNIEPDYLYCGRKSCFANCGGLCNILTDYPDGKSEDNCAFYKTVSQYAIDKKHAAERLARLGAMRASEFEEEMREIEK